jgi:hypothetical protein
VAAADARVAWADASKCVNLMLAAPEPVPHDGAGVLMQVVCAPWLRAPSNCSAACALAI